MTKKKEKTAQNKTLLGIDTPTKNRLKETAIHVGKEVVLGTVLGAAVGAAAGRSSLLVGAIVTGLGHYNGSSALSMFGAGMMASGGYQTAQKMLDGTQTPKDGMEGVKERLSAFKEGFLKRTWLDKIVTGKGAKSKSVNGTPEVQYFNYSGKDDGVGDLDMSGLDQIEDELARSAEQFKGESSPEPDQEPIY